MDIYINKDFKPMELAESKEAFDDKDYLFELKLDGTRTIIFAEPTEILIRNRRGVILNKTYPELMAIKELVKQKTIFDGEIILMADGKPSFNQLQQRARLKDKYKIERLMNEMPVVFVAYDLIYEGKDLTNLTLIERKKKLEKYPNNAFFVKAKYFENEGIKLYDLTHKAGLEGIVAKRKDSYYYPNKRSKDWLKIKALLKTPFYICGYQEKDNTLRLLLGEKEGGKYNYVGTISIRPSHKDYPIIKKEPVVKKGVIEKEEFTYIKPKLNCLIEYMVRTKNGRLRQPIYRGLV